MKESADGKPVVGRSARELGVRTGTAANPDVPAIDDGDIVSPWQGGMSVAPDDPLHLLRHRRPASLGGVGQDAVWYIETDDLPVDLQFRQDTPTHGLIEPARSMTLKEYENALASTRQDWILYCRG
jgi:hypothetical protein